MDTSYSYDDEITPLILIPGIPTAVRDKREPYKKHLALYLILASILCERIAFYSLADNLVPTLQSNQTVKWSSEHTTTVSFIFSGTRYISTLLFAALSDAKLGRTKTIIVGFVLYLIGYTLVIINSHETTSFCYFRNITDHNATSIFDEPCAAWILSTLICIAIAAGTVQVNMIVFGAEQIQKMKSISQYSDKYVFAINVADILTLVAIPYIQTKGPSYYFITYLVAGLILLLAILLFIIGCRYCIHVKAHDTVLTNCIPVVINAFQSWYRYLRNKHAIEKEYSSPPLTLVRATSYSFNAIEGSMSKYERPPTFLDFAKTANNGKFSDRIVDDVNALRRAIIAFSILIPYWLIYIQIKSTFPLQSEKMKLPYDDMPVVWMTLADPITIIIGIVILNIFVYKQLKDWEKETVIITKLLLGMCFAFLTMCATGIVEIFRQKGCIGEDKSSLSVFVQLPQNILMGLSELFAMIASVEFAYLAAPRSAQSLFMSLRFSAVGIASFIGSAYKNFFLTPADDDPNSNCFGQQESWRYYTYFFILAGVQLLFIFIFILCNRKGRIYELNPQQIETNQPVLHSTLPSSIRL